VPFVSVPITFPFSFPRLAIAAEIPAVYSPWYSARI
jgi:hypothetical protein